MLSTRRRRCCNSCLCSSAMVRCWCYYCYLRMMLNCYYWFHITFYFWSILSNVMKSEKGLKTLNYENEFLKHFFGNWHWMNLLFTNYLGINQGDPNQKLLIEMAIYAFLTPSWYNQNTFQSSTFILIFQVFVNNFQLFVSNFQLCVYNLQNKCTPLKRIFT